MKKIAMAIVSLALLGATAADAKTRRHHHHHRHHQARTHLQPAPSFVPIYAIAAVGGDLVARARNHLGQTAAQVGVRRNLWCGAFLNKVAGGGTGSDLAKSWLAKPRTSPRVGAVAVMGRGRGGHVGIVSGFDGAGNPIIISGNHNRRVAETVYPKGRVIAYVTP